MGFLLLIREELVDDFPAKHEKELLCPVEDVFYCRFLNGANNKNQPLSQMKILVGS